MRRTVLAPLVSVLLLGAVLVPNALGLLRSTGPLAEPATGSAASPADATATTPTTEPPAGSVGSGDDRWLGEHSRPDHARRATDARHATDTAANLEPPPVDPPIVDPPPVDPPIVDPPPVVDVRPHDHPDPTIRLACELVRYDWPIPTDLYTIRPDIAPAIACHWSPVDRDDVHGYQLWRAIDVPDGGGRELIATVPADAPLRYLDTHIRPGHVYTYVVVAVAVDGEKIAVSPAVSVKVPPFPDELRLACAFASEGDHRGVICKWSETHHPMAAGYVLWRSVDGGPREAIYRTYLDGRTFFFDTKVEPGQTIRYAVLVVDKTGHAVGFGGPVVVMIPGPTAVGG